MKTNSRFRSSVPSDRFYDYLHLTFDFICQDSVNTSHFYYKLREDSPQQLRPTFYSGRIKYPEARGGDKYEAIAKYLAKAVREKKRANLLDCFVSFTGSGYNSECLLAWMDERLALTENFPLAWKNSRTAKFLNFRMEDYCSMNSKGMRWMSCCFMNTGLLIVNIFVTDLLRLDCKGI